MKKRIKILIIALLSLSLLACQEQVEEEPRPRLYPAYEYEANHKKWGYIDRRGNYIVEPEYDTAGEFIDGLALVERGGFFGVINDEGRLIIKPEYTNIGQYRNGYVTAYKNNQISVFDREGRELEIAGEYSNISGFSGGRFIVSKILDDGELKFGYIDESGKELIKTRYDMAYDYLNGRAIIKEGKNFKIIDEDGRKLEELDIEDLRPSGEEGIYIFSRDGESFGVISNEGEIILEDDYSSIVDLEADLIIVGESNDDGIEFFGAMDRQGRRILDSKYDDIRILNKDILAVSNEIGIYGSNLYRIIDRKGKELTEEKYYNVGGRDGRAVNGYISVSDGENTFLLDLKGQPQEDLISLAGYGEMEFDGDVLRAIVNDELTYYNRKMAVIWEAHNRYNLGGDREILEKKFTDSIVKISYPFFVGFKDREVQSDLNKKLEDTFLMDDYGQEPSDKFYKYYLVKYDIDQEGELVRIDKNSKYMDIDSVEEDLSKKVYNIDLETGHFFRLEDIFKKDSNYLEVLNEIVENYLNENSAISGYYELRRIGEKETFRLDKDSISFYLKYSDNIEKLKGYEEVIIPLEEVDEILDKESKLVKNVVKNRE